MAVTSVVLDIRANTDRALNEFKRFSSQLDNKFLVSGLKLDVVRNALGQINREFQKAIGEQGLQAGQSLRAAQNQAALLTQTFKGFASAASMDIATQFSSAFNEVAVKAGGTAQDIQKALAATPFISTNLSEDMRKALGQGVLSFQRDFRRAGLGEDFSGIARQFLMGQLSAGQMINSGDAAQSFLGTQLARSTGQVDLMTNAQQRSEALLNIIQDPAFNKQLTDMARRAYGFRGIIEDLNTRLFNPEKGVFGSLRQVTMSVRDKTTIFDETEKLINSVFGQQGLFVNFFKQIGKIFGIEDPLKVIIIGVRFITRQFNKLNEFIQDPAFQNVVKLVQGVFSNIKNFFTAIYDQTQSGSFQPEPINVQIRAIGEAVRGLFKQIGDAIRGKDISKEAEGGASVTSTILSELGKTIISFFGEVGGALLEKAGSIALELVKVLPGTIAKLFGSLFTEGGIIGQAIGTAIALRLGLGAGRLAAGGAGLLGQLREARTGEGGIRGAINRRLGSPFGSWARRTGDQLLEGGERGFQARMIALVTQIRDCVCRGLLGGGGPDIDVDGPDRRAAGRRRVQELGYAGPRRGVSSVPPLGAGGFPMDEALDPYTSARRNRPGLASRAGQFLFDTGGDVAFPGSLDRSRQNVAARFNRMYGSGGTRAVLGRGIRGLGRKVRVGGALGGVVAAVTLASAFRANASEGLSPNEKEQVQTSQRQQAGTELLGLAGGAVGGAVGTAIAGPVGTVIGGMLGDMAGRALASTPFMRPITEALGKFAEDAISLIGKAWNEISKFFNSIPSLLTKGLTVLTTDIPKRLLDFGKGLGESMLNSVSNFNLGQVLQDTWKNITNFVGQGNKPQAIGGVTQRGATYLVGERGPELWTATGSGTITNNATLNNLLASAGQNSSQSANATFNIAINVNGNIGAGDVESLRGPVLAIIQDAWNEVTHSTVTRGAVA